MTGKTINEVLAKAAERHSDGRTALFDLTASQPAPDHCLLVGTVLQQEDLELCLDDLLAAFPGVVFDAAEVIVLVRPQPQKLAVSTNLAGFHRQPSRATELMSQLFNGAVVDLLREEGSWALVRQQDGYLGWVQRAYMTAEMPGLEPTHMVTAPVVHMLAGPEKGQALVSRAFAGTAVPVTDQSAAYAHIELVGGHKGWVPAAALCPLEALPQTAAEQRRQMVSAAIPYTGVPYRWGGCSVFGIDCSGLVQLMHRLVGITILRDADMQFYDAPLIEPPFQPGDLLYFGNKDGDRAITHVGMSLGGWEIIHSSGPRNGVYKDNVQDVSWLRDAFMGANTFLNNGAGD